MKIKFPISFYSFRSGLDDNQRSFVTDNWQHAGGAPQILGNNAQTAECFLQFHFKFTKQASFRGLPLIKLHVHMLALLNISSNSFIPLKLLVFAAQGKKNSKQKDFLQVNMKGYVEMVTGRNQYLSKNLCSLTVEKVRI